MDFTNPNSQSFDEVLEKLKQSMKAARSGGWIDSDSGSELEIALEQSPHGSQAQAHPSRNGSTPRSINNNNSQHQHSFYIKDGGISARRADEIGEDHPTHSNLNLTSVPLASNPRSINPRAGEVSNLRTRPLTLASINHHLVDHPTSSTNHESRHSPLFDVPNSPYDPRTPSTPVSAGTSSGSPYVRHHFKWEYLPPSTTAEGAPKSALQPRFVESSSPPHSLNYDETHWPRGFHAKELACPNEASKFHSDPHYSHEVQRPAHLASNLGFAINNGYRSVSHSAAAHPKSRSPSQQCFGPGYNGRASTMGLPSNHMDGFNQPAFAPSQKPWGIAAPPQELKPLTQNALNLASVSSVPFSLAPAAPVRFSAPEVDGQTKNSSSLGRQASSIYSPIRESNAPVSFRDAPSAKAPSAISASVSSTASLRDQAVERDKQAIRARLMGVSSIDNFQTRLQSFNNSLGAPSPPTGHGVHPDQVSNLPGLFHQLRVSTSTQPISVAQSRVHSASESSSLRSISATYPSNHSNSSPVFHSCSSHPHGSVSRHGPFALSMASLPNNASQMTQLSPQTPITPIGFGVNAQLQSPNSGSVYSPTSPVNNKSPFLPVIVPAVPGIGGPVSAPLPGQVQPEEVRKSVKTQPPVVNTGNSGAMIPQPGDWMCICGFVNWRRRKVCMRCFPFADGNDSVGAMMALNAQRAALLAAGVPLPKDQPNGTLPMSNSTPAIFARPPIPSFQETASQQSPAKQSTFGQAPSPSESAFKNYSGRPLELSEIFNSQPQAQRMGLSPFDKSSPLGSISSSTPGISLNRSPDGSQGSYLEVNLHQLTERESEINETNISRPEKSSKSLRARLVAPGEEQQMESERNSWEDVLPKSPRPRSFSMGAKSAWESDEEIGPIGGGPNGQHMVTPKKSDNHSIGKEMNGNSGSKDALGVSHAVRGRLDPADNRQQEINTINNKGSTVNQQRATTSPTSSWQAIKVLWQ
ncbi:hypothetical protein PCANC_06607 [Puccinia coronata f. sp. avenae]|uniref:RanBP2-type domain-containing protein n=1 Tax=Puccinia coronata f. sp. avenae TaxID=200324 RepID=A0A2N5T038_9BASI|nr:hypothetical protein PCANC_06607 [Puccinia coronata f. sp. avenae]